MNRADPDYKKHLGMLQGFIHGVRVAGGDPGEPRYVPALKEFGWDGDPVDYLRMYQALIEADAVIAENQRG
jgi:hypothetical protein